MLENLKAKWNSLTPRNKMLVAGGVLVLLVLGAASQGGGLQGPGYGPAPYGPYAANHGQPNQGPGYQPGYPQGAYGPPAGPGGAYPANGYPPNAYPQGAPVQSASNDPTGYWARQASQDRQAQAFDGYINDTTTVRDTNDGTVYSNVTNDVAQPAIDAGVAAAVPTAELPTTYDSGSSSSSSE